MDGFKNSTKTQYSMGGYAKGGSKFGKVMSEFKAGTLHSGSKKGAEVTNPKQAVAIALSEARKAGAKLPVKKQLGGALTDVERRLLQTDMNDMGPADRARALKILGTPVVKKTSTTVVVAPAPKKAAVKPTGMTDAEKRMNDIENNETGQYKKGGTAKPSRADALRAQKYKAAMASRPKREPIVSGGPSSAASLAPLIRRAMAAKATQAAAAPPMEAAAPPMMGAPAMKKSGKVMKKDKGGPIKADFPDTQSGYARFAQNEADKEIQNLKDPTYKSPLNKKGRAHEMYVAQRRSDAWKSMSKYRLAPTTQKVTSDDMKSTYGPDAYKKGGMTDIKQDKAMVKKAVHKHEAAMHPGKPMTKLRKGGMPC